jgi:hypothetical protein
MRWVSVDTHSFLPWLRKKKTSEGKLSPPQSWTVMQGRYAAKLFAYPLLILAVTAYLPLPSSHLRLRALSRGAGHVLRRQARTQRPFGSARRDINYGFRQDASGHPGFGWHPKYSNALLSLRSQTADVKEERLLSPESLAAVPVLQRVANAANDAVTLSTGEGTESSGKGRYEWGTWCDDSLFAVLKETINDVVLKGSPELWQEALWPAVGGEQVECLSHTIYIHIPFDLCVYG